MMTNDEKLKEIKELLFRVRRTLVHTMGVPADQENYLRLLICEIEAILDGIPEPDKHPEHLRELERIKQQENDPVQYKKSVESFLQMCFRAMKQP